jgi:hypothetical protein
MEGFVACTNVESIVSVSIDPSLPPRLVNNAALGHIRSFVDTYNANQSKMKMVFEYPITVESTIRATLVGISKLASGSQAAQTFLQVFYAVVGKLLQANEAISFQLQNLQILNENPSNSTVATRLLQSVPTDAADLDLEDIASAIPNDVSGTNVQIPQGVPYTDVGLWMQAICGGLNCTDQALDEFFANRGDAVGAALSLALRGAEFVDLPAYVNLSLFEDLQDVYVNHNVVDQVEWTPGENSRVVEQYGTGDYFSQPLPTWFWIMVGVDSGIVLLAFVWVGWRLLKRRRQLEMATFDDERSDSYFYPPPNYS